MGSCCNARGCDRGSTRGSPGTPNRYRKRGLDKATQRIVDLVTHRGVDGATVLEVGGGVGDIQLELLEHGAARTINVELSPAYEDEAPGCSPTLGSPTESIDASSTSRLVQTTSNPSMSLCCIGWSVVTRTMPDCSAQSRTTPAVKSAERLLENQQRLGLGCDHRPQRRQFVRGDEALTAAVRALATGCAATTCSAAPAARSSPRYFPAPTAPRRYASPRGSDGQSPPLGSAGRTTPFAPPRREARKVPGTGDRRICTPGTCRAADRIRVSMAAAPRRAVRVRALAGVPPEHLVKFEDRHVEQLAALSPGGGLSRHLDPASLTRCTRSGSFVVFARCSRLVTAAP
jgi:hypothetical protein